jgi:hypothetical protein
VRRTGEEEGFKLLLSLFQSALIMPDLCQASPDFGRPLIRAAPMPIKID